MAIDKTHEPETCCIPTDQHSSEALCPACGMKGSAVRPVTLRFLLKEEFRSQIRDEPYRFCANPGCEVVHFSQDGSQQFTKQDLTVRVGLKEKEDPRPLCYCFGHSFESLKDEWTATGQIGAVDSIKAELKAGTCQCEITNPRGACCLGDVIKAVKEIQGMGTTPGSPHEQEASMSDAQDCCTRPTSATAPPETCCDLLTQPDSPEGPQEIAERKRTIWGAIGLGVLASACCWVPLALAGLGVAGGAVGAKVAWIRPWALGGTLLLVLGVVGWWARMRVLASKRAEACCPLVRFPTLPVVVLLTSFILAWAAPHLLHPGRETAVVAFGLPAPAGGTMLVLSTPQFDCEPCAGNLPQVLAKTPGVSSVEMDFGAKQTRIVFATGADVNRILQDWQRFHGFEGVEVRRQAM